MRLAATVLAVCSISVPVTGVIYAPPAQACSCVATATSAAATTSGLIATGSTLVASQMTLGFQQVGSTVSAANGKQSKSLVQAIELMTKTLGSELRKVPVAQQEIERRLDQYDPARQVSEPCRYTDRSIDISASTSLVALQSQNLDRSSSAYNEMTSSYPDGVDKSSRFNTQTYQLLKERPEVETAGMKMVAGPNSFGALSPEEVQEAATFINLTTNPNPPAKSTVVSSQATLNANVEADLYNIRMSLPQSVQNQILSYETPIMVASDGSWLAESLKATTPHAEAMIENAEDGVAYSDLLNIMSTHRIKNPVWLAELSLKGQAGALKELALIKADSMLLDHELWKQERSTALQMSQLLAAQLRAKRDSE